MTLVDQTCVDRPTASAKAGCPRDMTLVDQTCVDRYEASLVEVLPDGREIAHSPYENPAGKKVKAVSRAGVIPQAHVSFHDARAACENSGKRLCAASEWVAACKGPKHTRYPYGDEHVANACVDTGRTPPLPKYYAGADMYSSRAMNDPRLNQTPNTIEKAGAAASCTNEFGAHDMVGNVHEWAADGAFHGGYYLDTHINNAGCDYITTAHSRDYYDYSIGFRCCADEGSLPVEEREVDESFYANVAWIALGSGGLPGSNLALAFSLGAVLPVTTPRDHDRFASR
jgi:hypothetical protein